MKFHINRKEALSAARKAALAVPEKSPIAEFTGILLEADENTGQVSFFGSDLRTAIRCEMQADIETGGGAIVNAQLLTGMLNLTSGDRVSVESLENGLLCLKCQNTQYTVATLKPDLLTKVKIPVPQNLVRLTGLRSLERFTTFAAAKKDPKQTLECVRLEITPNSIQAAACDSHRLIETREKAESGGFLEFLLPAKSLRVLAGLVEDTEIIYLGIQDHSAIFFRPGLYFTSRIVEVPYLDVEALLATPGKYRALAASKDFRQAVETVTTVIDGYSSLQLRFTPDKKILLSCDGPSGITANTQLETGVLNAMPEDTSFYYNASDFVQGIRLLEGMLALSISQDGILIAANGSEKYMLIPRRPIKRLDKSKKDDSLEGKKTAAKKKTTKTKTTAAKAA